MPICEPLSYFQCMWVDLWLFFVYLVGCAIVFDTFVLDLVQTLRSSPLYPLVGGEVLNLSSGGEFSVFICIMSVGGYFHVQ